jgi:hypothetical protein
MAFSGKEIMLADVNQSQVVAVLEGGWLVMVILDEAGQLTWARYVLLILTSVHTCANSPV